MDYKAFYQNLQEGNLPGALLVSGEEEYTKEGALAALRSKYLPEGLEDLNENLLGVTATADEIVETCEMLPFMAQKRIVIVRDSRFLAKGDKSEDARLMEYLVEIPTHVMLIFYQHGVVDKTRKLYKRMEALKAVVDFERLNEKDMAIFLSRAFTVAHKTIASDAVHELVLRAGPFLTALNTEIKKLVAYCGDKAQVEREDVLNLVSLSPEASVFQMLDMILRGQSKEGLAALSGLLVARQAEPVQVLTLATSAVRTLYQIKLLQSKGLSEAELQSALEESSWRLRKNLPIARRFSLDQLKMLLTLCADLDFRFKSGKVSDEGAMYLWVGKVLNLRAAGKR